MKLMQTLGLEFLILSLMCCTVLPTSNVTEQPTASATPAMSVRIDISGALTLLNFCQDLHQRRPWDETAIRQMVTSPPYQALIAHHSRMDSQVTAEAIVMLLLALRDGQAWSSASDRLNRIYTAYRSACGQFTSLRVQVELLQDSLPLEQALMRAREALPAQAHIEATVYLLADGRSTGYVVGKCIVLDLLQKSHPAEIEATLAHELHHVGVSSLLPAPCPDFCLGEVLETLADLVQEGAATYWVDNQRLSAAQGDYAQVEVFLRDVLLECLNTEEVAARRQKLVQGVYGPLYRVGNEMIAALVSAHGKDWVLTRLGDPVGLFRTWLKEQEVSLPLDQEVLAQLDKAEALGSCPDWFPQMR